jgi:hypothetical protein
LNLLSESKPDKIQLDQLVRSIYHEMIVIEIQSVIRGIDNPRIVLQAFEKARVQVPSSYSSEELKQRPGEALDASWNERKKIVFECVTSTTTKNFKAVADVLYGLGQDNA